MVWACGPWLATLFPDVVDLRVDQAGRPLLRRAQDLAHAGVPAWLDYQGAFYGQGDLDGRGVKAATDARPRSTPTPATAPWTGRWSSTSAATWPAFPPLVDAPLLSHRCCQYELTADNRFIAAPHPEHPSVWILGGGSGHGFKHGPALGRARRGVAERRRGPRPDAGAGRARGAGVAEHVAGEPARGRTGRHLSLLRVPRAGWG